VQDLIMVWMNLAILINECVIYEDDGKRKMNMRTKMKIETKKSRVQTK